MTDYTVVKAYRDLYGSGEAFKSACHAAFPVERTEKTLDRELSLFIEQEASYQLLEQMFYPCRATAA